MKLLNSRQIQDLDRETIEGLEIPAIVLMENAARALCVELEQRYPQDRHPFVLALAGKGNNGGDAMASARILSGKGYRVFVALCCSESDLKGDAAVQYRICRKLGLSMTEVTKAPQLRQFIQREITVPKETVLIDGLFGVGLQRPVESGFWAEIMDIINEFGGPVVAVDLPSGIMETENLQGKRVNADLTVSFQEPKTALIRRENRGCAGLIRVVDIGIPTALYAGRTEYLIWIDHSLVLPLLEDQEAFAHKNQFGHGLAVVGSERMPGAGILAVASALRGGVGLCTALVPRELAELMAHSSPEAMLHFRDEPLDLSRYASILVGPGLGRDAAAASLLRQVMNGYGGVLVLDADALNLLADTDMSQSDFMPGVRLILTPHSGEMARLLQMEREEVERDRIQAAKKLALRFGATVVLKGRYSLVADANGTVWVNPTGNSGMATAGSGDVLAGLIMAFAARFSPGFPLHQIVSAAVWLHGRSGDLAVGKRGQIALKAGDLIEYLPLAMQEREGYEIQI